MKLLSQPSIVGLVAIATLLTTSVQHADAFGSMVDYNGTVCNGFIDYKVWIPDGVTVDLIEQQLIKDGIQDVAALVDPCKSTYMAYACSSAFPRPVITGQSKHLVLVHRSLPLLHSGVYVLGGGRATSARQILLSNLLTSLEEVGGGGG
ncbi:MAG: hypothetical protein J3Q66DRAFT_311247 [Benniella sp.]|nr:MAG: hypothetical protein J3Q66DRAFT_311247 [Benniella sp.]